MSGRHSTHAPLIADNDYADITRHERADSQARANVAALPYMPPASYVAMESATGRAQRIAIIRKAGRARLHKLLWSLALIASSALGIVGLALTDNIPGLG